MNSGVGPMKSEDFFHFIQIRTYETQGFIVHELANKYNILSLGIEDLIDLIQDEGSSEEEIRGEISAVEARSKNFAEVIGDLRSFGKKGMNESRSFNQVYSVVAKIKGDKLKDRKVIISQDVLELNINFYPGLMLLWGLITLSLQQNEPSLEFILTNDNSITIKGLPSYLETYDEGFRTLFVEEAELLNGSLGL